MSVKIRVIKDIYAREITSNKLVGPYEGPESLRFVNLGWSCW
jgi:hypothetical protein